MSKLQPNFSWQKYEGKEEDQKEQFQYQLQSQFINTANAINTTVDDLSYWLRERPTAFTWVNTADPTITGGLQPGPGIYTQTFQALVSAFPITHGITSTSGAALQLNLVRAYGVVQDTIPMTAKGLPVPYADPNTSTNSIGMYVTPTQIFLVTNGGIYNAYTATITIEYTKN